MSRIGTLCVLLMCAAPAAAQEVGPALAPNQALVTPPRAAAQGVAAATTPDASPDPPTSPSASGIVNTGLLVLPLAQAASQQAAPPDGKTRSQPARPSDAQHGFQWSAAFEQYMMMLTFQHSLRLFQEKTHTELGGPFWADYVESVASLHGWDDGDSFATNYVAHPMMGAVTGYIQIQNDPAGRDVQFGRSGAYWRSRGWALAAAAIYSAQFELGPMSEAAIGNVGLRAGTMAYVDLVITPVVGVGMIVAEDVIDRYLIAKVEGRMGWVQARILRSILNPNRSVANMIRLEAPWKRDARGLAPRGNRGVAMAEAPRAVAAVSTR
jgi:hypothetical protein